jgi:hypothetical protein
LYALLKEKLLMNIKNYLINGVNDWSRMDLSIFRCWSKSLFHNINCRIHWIRFIMDVYDMAFWGKNVRLEQKKIISEKKNKRYNVLNEHVFTPLYNILITFTVPKTLIVSNNYETEYYDDKFNKLIDISSIEKNRHYTEAYKHLAQDIECFKDRFTEIKNNVKTFNDTLDNFRNYELDICIKEYLDIHNLEITVTNPASRKLNKSLLKYLKELWFDGNNFELISTGRDLRIERNEIIAVFSNDVEKTEIENCINNLKKYDKIIKKIEYFKNEPTKILEKGIKLSKKIENNIITKIEIDEYQTKCDMCKNWMSLNLNLYPHFELTLATCYPLQFLF